MSLEDEHVAVLITGVSASGKSTVADGLARRFRRGVHVKGDVFRRMVVAGRDEMTASPSDEALRQLRLRYRLGASTTDRYFEAGFSVVVQDVVVGPLLADYLEMIRSRPLCVVVLVPSTRAVEEREAARDKVGYHPGAHDIAALDGALRTSTPHVGLWLDTSAQTPDETIDEIVARAWDVRLEGTATDRGGP
jgi:chloramphenicol 3-O-phosphotransferase